MKRRRTKTTVCRSDTFDLGGFFYKPTLKSPLFLEIHIETYKKLALLHSNTSPSPPACRKTKSTSLISRAKKPAGGVLYCCSVTNLPTLETVPTQSENATPKLFLVTFRSGARCSRTPPGFRGTPRWCSRGCSRRCGCRCPAGGWGRRRCRPPLPALSDATYGSINDCWHKFRPGNLFSPL